MSADEKSMKLRWLDQYCDYCGEQMNTWDERVRKALMFTFPICEKCIAEEYGMTRDYLRDSMSRRFGMHPCEGL